MLPQFFLFDPKKCGGAQAFFGRCRLQYTLGLVGDLTRLLWLPLGKKPWQRPYNSGESFPYRTSASEPCEESTAERHPMPSFRNVDASAGAGLSRACEDHAVDLVDDSFGRGVQRAAVSLYMNPAEPPRDFWVMAESSSARVVDIQEW